VFQQASEFRRFLDSYGNRDPHKNGESADGRPALNPYVGDVKDVNPSDPHGVLGLYTVGQHGTGTQG